MGRFTALLVSCVMVLATAAQSQDKPKVPRVVVLDWGSPSQERFEQFRGPLRELGYVEGRNISTEYLSAEGRSDRAAALAAEIVKRGADIIVPFATPAAHAVKRATSTIPIVAVSADPVGTGLVSNLARPGGNITGVSMMMTDLESKRLELLREFLPGIKRIAFLGAAPDPATKNFVREAQRAAQRIGVHLEPVLIESSKEIEGALVRLSQDKTDAVIVQPLFTLNKRSAARVAELALRHRVPAIANYALFPQAGGLVSYGPFADFGRRAAADYVDRVLKGAAPGDLPIVQPTEFQLVVNRKTANVLGLTIPLSILLRANEVIE